MTNDKVELGTLPTGLDGLHPITQKWFFQALGEPTEVQRRAFPAIAKGNSTLLLAPTGSGKTLAAFLVALNRLLFIETQAPTKTPKRPKGETIRSGTKVLYLSPLKALAFDVERNLEVPLAGIVRLAEAAGVPYREVTVSVRTGDTSAVERARFLRKPSDVLITTPESLFLMLTSNARHCLSDVETVIIDEIHAVVPTKRGAHLMVSLERLEALRTSRTPLQRIGLSATQKPLSEVAEFLGGGSVTEQGWQARPVEIIDASAKKNINLSIEVTHTDLAEITDSEIATEHRTSVWESMFPVLVKHIKAHRSTMVFVNSRRLAERLAASINEVAGEDIALAHHGSVAREQRVQIEARLKSGLLPCIVATSSLELGIDIGAVDLVIQIETPPSIASGLQRIGRANHQVLGTSQGILFPKNRSDLLTAAVSAELMRHGQVEAIRYPRNPLDVLAQHIASMVSAEPMKVSDVFNLVRQSAPYRGLPEDSFLGVVDMLTGKYPSTEFADLRPRLSWDHSNDQLEARKGTKAIVIANAGVITDRGLYGVFLDTGDRSASRLRVGELDEELVFEIRPGEVFALGASAWKVTEITHDRVWVIPAPGEAARLPFWRGDRPPRSVFLGTAIGEACEALNRNVDGRNAPRKPTQDNSGRKKSSAKKREANSEPVAQWAEKRFGLVTGDAILTATAARNLLDYIAEQIEESVVPTDRTLVIERFTDDLGDARVVLLSAIGGKVLAPLAMILREKILEATAIDTEPVWTDDGIVFRWTGPVDEQFDLISFFPDEEEVSTLLLATLSRSALFAAKFREAAARSLLLPKRAPNTRAPLWQQRKKAYDLLAVASKYSAFPVLLEASRECLSDVFEVAELKRFLSELRSGHIRVRNVVLNRPSAFSANVVFSYASNFVYDTDAPLAERRSQLLRLDHQQLRNLLGESVFDQLFDPGIVEELQAKLQRLDPTRKARDADELHDMLRNLGDLTTVELQERASFEVTEGLAGLIRQRRALVVRLGLESRVIDSSDLGHAIVAFGVVPPIGTVQIGTVQAGTVPQNLAVQNEPKSRDISADQSLSNDTNTSLRLWLERYARTRVLFTLSALTARYPEQPPVLARTLAALETAGVFIRGQVKGDEVFFIHKDVLIQLKRLTLAKLRSEIEPVTTARYANFLFDHHELSPLDQAGGYHVTGDALERALYRLSGYSIPFGILEGEILKTRLLGYKVGDIDMLLSSGEFVWQGQGSLQSGLGRIVLFPRAGFAALCEPKDPSLLSESARAMLALLETKGAMFFHEILSVMGGFPADLFAVLYDLVWAGWVTNDTLLPLRRLLESKGAHRDHQRHGGLTPVRRPGVLPGTQGRWSVLPTRRVARAAADWLEVGDVLLDRYGVVTPNHLSQEMNRSFRPLYDVYASLEERGQLRRGYFVESLSALQFARAGVEDRLRMPSADKVQHHLLSVLDPANPFGTIFKWPDSNGSAAPQRTAHAWVYFKNGDPVFWIQRKGQSDKVISFLPNTPLEVAAGLKLSVDNGPFNSVYLTDLDGRETPDGDWVRHFEPQGFTRTPNGVRYFKKGSGFRRERRDAPVDSPLEGDDLTDA